MTTGADSRRVAGRAITESSLTRQLIAVIEQQMSGAVVLKHADRYTSGIPDMSVTWRGVTTWWECKHAKPRFKSQGLQELIAARLAMHSAGCRYIIFGATRTYLVHPDQLHTWRDAAQYCNGYDLTWVVKRIEEFHR